MKKTLFRIVLGWTCFLGSFAIAEDEHYLFFSPQMRSSHLKDYSLQEKEAIEKDLQVVRSVCWTLVPEAKMERKPLYLATGGAPGSRKTTILERHMEKEFASFPLVYVDPDQRGLKFMVHTYYNRSLCAKVLAESTHYIEAAQRAYEKWRGSSNYIAVTLLEQAFAQRRDIAHGTTLTGDHVPAFLSKVREAGYEIVLLLCSSEDSFREQAVRYRNEEQKFYQSTPEDVVGKWKAFPQKMSTFFAFGDQLYLFWSDDLETPERLAAILTYGHIKVCDQEALDCFMQKFARDRDLLLQEGKQVPSWKELVNLYKARFYY